MVGLLIAAAYLTFCWYAHCFWSSGSAQASSSRHETDPEFELQVRPRLAVATVPAAAHVSHSKSTESDASERKASARENMQDLGDSAPAISTAVDPEKITKNERLHFVKKQPVLQSIPEEGRVHRPYSREQETCDAMQTLYGKAFFKVRPSWLRNLESGRCLEIDCFNEELQIGAEFNGIAHYKFPNPFHRSLEEFQAQQRRDNYKLELCQQRGVKLFVVPDTVKKGRILTFLKDKVSHCEFEPRVKSNFG